jgi:hypothetical protein
MTYCRNRNEQLKKFLAFLEDGNDPFDGIEVEGKVYCSLEEYSISLTPSEDEKIVLVEEISSFDILTADENDYILVVVKDYYQQVHEILFSTEWIVLDVRNILLSRQNTITKIIVSENYPDYFWVQNTTEDGYPTFLTYGRIVNNKMMCFVKMHECELVSKEGKHYFRCANPDFFCSRFFSYDFHYLDEGELLYLDPFSGREVNGIFRNELSESLELLYSLYSYQHSKFASLGKYFYKYSNMEIEIPKRRLKKLRIANGINGIYNTERCLRKYGLEKFKEQNPENE